MYLPHLPYPFLFWWTFMSLPCSDWCKQCCSEHWCTCVSFILVYLVCIPSVRLLGCIQPVYFKQNISTWRFQGMERPPWQLPIMPGLYLWCIVMLCRNKYQHTQAWQSSPSIHLLPKTGSVGCNHWFTNLRAQGSNFYLKVLSLPLLPLPLPCFRCRISFSFLPCR